MSIKIMSLVWDGFPGGGSELLAMLALADWSDDNGRCYPAVSSIARKTRLSRSQAQRIVHRLIDDGFLVVTANALGGAPTQTRHYRIVLASLTGSADATGSVRATGSTHAQEGSHPCAIRGSAHATQTVIEPSISVKGVSSTSVKAKRKASEITLQAFLDACKADGTNAILDSDPIFDYAEKVGISREMVSACWAEFKAAYLNPSKLQADWRAAFRNSVRKNYYKLWYLKESEAAQWTTAGEQARRAAA